MCTCGDTAARKSFCIDGAQLHLLHRGLIRWGTHALPRITLEHQKANWEHDEIDPCFSSPKLGYLFISVGRNLLVHLSIDVDVCRALLSRVKDNINQ